MTLNEFLRQGRPVWDSIRTWLVGLVTDEAERDLVEPHLVPLDEVELGMPFAVGDYVDFYSSLDHATNVGRIFRPDAGAAAAQLAAPAGRLPRPRRHGGAERDAGGPAQRPAPAPPDDDGRCSGRAPGSTSRPSSAS